MNPRNVILLGGVTGRWYCRVCGRSTMQVGKPREGYKTGFRFYSPSVMCARCAQQITIVLQATPLSSFQIEALLESGLTPQEITVQFGSPER